MAVGTEMRNVIQFQTNDPQHPTGRIEAVVRRVSGGVHANPESLVFGTVPIGTKVRQLVEVRDNAVPPRVVERVVSTNAKRFTVQLLPVADPSDTSKPDSAANRLREALDGRVIARLEVTVDTAIPGEVNGAVEIYVSGPERKPDTFAVTGRVAAPIEMAPSLIVLPRQSNNGPVNSGTFVCRSTKGKPLTLVVDSVPRGLSAEVLENGSLNPESKLVQVVWAPQPGKDPAPGTRRTIRLRARVEDYETTLELPVLLRK